VAIRLGRGPWPGLRSEALMPQEIFPVCAPSIARTIRSVDDLASATVITDENSMITWDSWFEAAGIDPVALRPGASFTDPTLCLESTIAGHGVMLGWQLLVADALADGRLVAPFGICAQSGLGYFMVTSQNRSESRKVRDFKAWMREEIAETMRVIGRSRAVSATG
jgi:DNA-binding transcriptional LysR family regulator